MVSADDKQAGEMLVACMPALSAFVRRRVSDGETASEILQEVSLRALAGDGPRDLDRFLSWSRGIARHVIGTEWRRRRRERSEPARDEVPIDQIRDPLAAPDQHCDAQVRLKRVFSSDTAGVALLVRRYFDRVSGKDLAAEMGLTPDALRMRLMRTRSAARARSEKV